MMRMMIMLMKVGDVGGQLAEMFDEGAVDERLPTGSRLELTQDSHQLFRDRGGIGRRHRDWNPGECGRGKRRRFLSTETVFRESGK